MRNSNFKYLFNVLILVLFFYELNCFIIPNINTELIRLPKQSTDLTGNLEPNTLLQNAQYIGEKKLKGPESIVFDDDGNMYTGIATGQIVKVDKNDQNNIQIVTRIGEETDDSICSMNIF
jgi:hypothetical protein